jgi:DNA-binding NarL/FixJ family response regulator
MNTNNKVSRILVADDHPVLRMGIAALLANETDMQVIGEASTGYEAIAQFRLLRPDVTLLDMQMPQMDGMDALIAIRSEFPSARIIVLTTYGGDALARRALEAGAQAYVLKGMIREELIDIIRAVLNGQRRVSSDVARQLANHIGDDQLSIREMDVLRLMAEGNSNRRIAQALSISETTTKSHVQSILGKLEARDRSHAVALALTRGIIRLSAP